MFYIIMTIKILKITCISKAPGHQRPPFCATYKWTKNAVFDGSFKCATTNFANGHHCKPNDDPNQYPVSFLLHIFCASPTSKRPFHCTCGTSTARSDAKRRDTRAAPGGLTVRNGRPQNFLKSRAGSKFSKNSRVRRWQNVAGLPFASDEFPGFRRDLRR